MIPVSIVVYWMMIFWLKQSDTWKLKQSDTCVNGGLLNDDTLIKTKWYLEIKTKWYLTNVSMVVYWNDDILIKTNVSIVVYWMMIFWLKQSDTCVNSGLLNDDILIKTNLCQWWFIEWWYFD